MDIGAVTSSCLLISAARRSNAPTRLAIPWRSSLLGSARASEVPQWYAPATRGIIGGNRLRSIKEQVYELVSCTILVRPSTLRCAQQVAFPLDSRLYYSAAVLETCGRTQKVTLAASSSLTTLLLQPRLHSARLVDQVAPYLYNSY